MGMVRMGQKISRRYSSKGRGHFGLSRVRTKLRITSNVGLIVGQVILLFVSRDTGLAVIILSSLMSVPFFLKEKMWDVLILIAFMQVINITGLLVK